MAEESKTESKDTEENKSEVDRLRKYICTLEEKRSTVVLEQSKKISGLKGIIDNLIRDGGKCKENYEEIKAMLTLEHGAKCGQ